MYVKVLQQLEPLVAVSVVHFTAFQLYLL